ncbi:MAG TPA: hypothetical protein VL614_10365 [Acetobacteraceae bacterium]|jgi:hypothetical protein|nr:hypothetical protein [Acetobacteraceae bacterium]
MATPRIWSGGGNNKASNPIDWSPAGRPQPGDNLMMNAGTTIDIRGNDLAGNPLTYRSDDTMNLSHGANVSAQAAVVTAPPDFADNVVFNVRGMDTLNVSSAGFEADVTVNIAANSRWVGGFNAVEDKFTVNGAAGASFSNQFSSGTKVNPVINADVNGQGTIAVGDFSQWEFTKSVSAGQTVHLADLFGAVQIDHPQRFHAKVVADGLPNTASQARVNLLGLATADSYTYKNDLLKLYSGNKVIDTMSLSGAVTAATIGVEKTSTGISVLMDRDIAGQTELLPLHGVRA